MSNLMRDNKSFPVSKIEQDIKTSDWSVLNYPVFSLVESNILLVLSSCHHKCQQLYQLLDQQ